MRPIGCPETWYAA